MLKYVLAVLAACANATSSVLQREEQPGRARNEDGYGKIRSEPRAGIPISGGNSDSQDGGSKRPVRGVPGGGEC